MGIVVCANMGREICMSNQEKILELCQELSYITDICVEDFLKFIDKNCGDYSG